MKRKELERQGNLLCDLVRTFSSSKTIQCSCKGNWTLEEASRSSSFLCDFLQPPPPVSDSHTRHPFALSLSSLVFLLRQARDTSSPIISGDCQVHSFHWFHASLFFEKRERNKTKKKRRGFKHDFLGKQRYSSLVDLFL